jgi:hypothetical protein
MDVDTLQICTCFFKEDCLSHILRIPTGTQYVNQKLG